MDSSVMNVHLKNFCVQNIHVRVHLSPPEFIQVQVHSQLQSESKYPTLDFMHKLNNSFSVLLNTQNNQYRCAKTHTHLCRIWPTESTHFLKVGGIRAWEFPDVMSTTQVLLDSKSEMGREPSSKSWLTPPPQLTAWLKRFIWKDTQNISDYNNKSLIRIQLGL